MFEETHATHTHRIRTKYLKCTRVQSKQDILNRDSNIRIPKSDANYRSSERRALSRDPTWNREGRFTSSRTDVGIEHSECHDCVCKRQRRYWGKNGGGEQGEDSCFLPVVYLLTRIWATPGAPREFCESSELLYLD